MNLNFARNLDLMPQANTVVFVLLLLLAACSKRQIQDPAPFDTAQLAYFPLTTGHYVVYRVDSLVFDPAPGGTARDSSSTFVKEMIADSLLDNTGQWQYIMERYERKTTSAPWALKFVGTASRTNTQAVRTEQNLRFLKMVFPMNKRSNWDGNLWIDKNREIEIAGERMQPFINWQYDVDSIDVASSIGGFTFDSTLIITEANYSDVIERRFSRAWYAKHVGLVKREQWILDSQYCAQFPPPPDCQTRPWELKAEKGYILRQTVLEFN